MGGFWGRDRAKAALAKAVGSVCNERPGNNKGQRPRWRRAHRHGRALKQHPYLFVSPRPLALFLPPIRALFSPPIRAHVALYTFSGRGPLQL